MIRNYRDLTRWEMEQVDRENTIVLIPLGALEQHGKQAPRGLKGKGADVIHAHALGDKAKAPNGCTQQQTQTAANAIFLHMHHRG